ncbi:MAG: methylthioribulose 1-phosphate dehydratase [Bacteroidota bacterium]|jgi:methylthioribulose-1-phosphate dehydratase
MTTLELREKIAETVRDFHRRGWSPATSTNYSFRDTDGTIWVSRSGIDKSQFSHDDFITVDVEGVATGEFEGIRPSAETLIHCVLYELFPDTKVILHSHSVYPVVLSAFLPKEFVFEGYEVQKGFEGQTTHEKRLSIPIFENTQDMLAFRNTLRHHAHELLNHSFIMRKHGVYAWGRDLFEAKRHIETLEYLAQCEWLLKAEKINTFKTDIT